MKRKTSAIRRGDFSSFQARNGSTARSATPMLGEEIEVRVPW
jgi:hypothetical protein